MQNIALNGRIITTFAYYLALSTLGLVAITTANLVDGVFVGNYVGANALAVITLLLPYFTLLVALSLMIAIGGSVSAGGFMGQARVQQASIVFSQSLLTVLVTVFIFAVCSAVFEPALFKLLKIPPSLSSLAREYFAVIRWVLIVQLFTMVLYYFVRADGHPKLATAALVVGATVNILLDAWFIVGLKQGLRGAAYGTAIAQVIQLLILCRYFFSPHRSLRLVYRFNLTQWRYMLRSAYNGVSEFVNEVSVAMVFLLINHLLVLKSGVRGVAAFSVANYFIFLSIMLSYGIGDTLHLLASQNFGAKNTRRLEKFLHTAVLCSLTLGASMALLIYASKPSVIAWFLREQDTHIAGMAGQLLSVIWPLFLVNGTNIVFSCYLTAIHQPKASAVIAMARGLLFPAGLLSLFYYLLNHMEGLKQLDNHFGFMFALPLAEWLTLLLAIGLLLKYKPSRLFATQVPHNKLSCMAP